MMSVTVVLMFINCVTFGVAEIRTSNFANNEINEDENRQYAKEEASSTSSDREFSNHFTDTIPGDPLLDYPTYTEIPRTGFSCKGKVNWRYYADMDTHCQVFHVCERDNSKLSFVCPIGSIFNQRHLVCDWWYNFDCNDAESLYTLTNDFNTQEQSEEDFGNRRGFELSLAASGGNTDYSSTSTTEAHIVSFRSEKKFAPIDKR